MIKFVEWSESKTIAVNFVIFVQIHSPGLLGFNAFVFLHLCKNVMNVMQFYNKFSTFWHSKQKQQP